MNKSHFKHPIIGILLQTEVNLEIKLDIIKVNFYMSTILFILKGRGKKMWTFFTVKRRNSVIKNSCIFYFCLIHLEERKTKSPKFNVFTP
jgi:hypothetical protein